MSSSLRRVRWPPADLGIGTWLNSVLASESERSRLFRSLWLYIAVGVAAAAGILVLDWLLFAGASLSRIRALRSESVPARLLVVLVSALVEELIYRVFLSTVLAWL